MSEEFTRDQLFRPFQTTKPEGVGLGLYTSSQILLFHRGDLVVKSRPGAGTLVRAILPVEGALVSGREGRLAIVEDDRLLLDQLVFALKGTFDVVTATDAVAGLALLEREPDLFLIDLRLPPSREAEEGLALLAAIRSKRPEAAVVVMTGETDRRYALRAVELGAFDFFRKPVEKAELLLVLRRALERARLLAENRALKDEILSGRSFDGLVGASAPMRALFAKIGRVAPSDATVLLQGESGTGKELVAEAIHRESPRKGGPFVAVNGSALPESLAESELFGHEKGAFTGAVEARPGKFELAHGGTLFLDEVATLSPAIQSKLLRVLEGRAFERVGGNRTDRGRHPPHRGGERGSRQARREGRPSARTSSTGSTRSSSSSPRSASAATTSRSSSSSSPIRAARRHGRPPRRSRPKRSRR